MSTLNNVVVVAQSISQQSSFFVDGLQIQLQLQVKYFCSLTTNQKQAHTRQKNNMFLLNSDLCG